MHVDVAPRTNTSTAPMRRMAIIDRDRSFARQVGRTFESEGYDVEWYDVPGKALRALRSRTFDLLLTAAVRPGADFCRRARSEALRTDVAIIAMTDDASAHVETLRAGVDESV